PSRVRGRESSTAAPGVKKPLGMGPHHGPAREGFPARPGDRRRLPRCSQGMTTASRAHIALFLSLAACEPILVGSQEATTLTPAVDGFQRLDLSREADATVMQGSPSRVEVTVNENLRDHLLVRMAGDRLEIGMEDGYDYHQLILEVRVTMPTLT